MNNIYLISMFILFIYFNIVFVVAKLKKSNAIVDIAWGFGFVLIAINSYYSGPKTFLALITTALVMLWGLRLSYHLFKRNWNKKGRFTPQKHNLHTLAQSQ